MLVLLRSSATEKRPIIIRLALSYSISVAACYRLRSASPAPARSLARSRSRSRFRAFALAHRRAVSSRNNSQRNIGITLQPRAGDDIDTRLPLSPVSPYLCHRTLSPSLFPSSSLSLCLSFSLPPSLSLVLHPRTPAYRLNFAATPTPATISCVAVANVGSFVPPRCI